MYVLWMINVKGYKELVEGHCFNQSDEWFWSIPLFCFFLFFFVCKMIFFLDWETLNFQTFCTAFQHISARFLHKFFTRTKKINSSVSPFIACDSLLGVNNRNCALCSQIIIPFGLIVTWAIIIIEQILLKVTVTSWQKSTEHTQKSSQKCSFFLNLKHAKYFVAFASVTVNQFTLFFSVFFFSPVYSWYYSLLNC